MLNEGGRMEAAYAPQVEGTAHENDVFFKTKKWGAHDRQKERRDRAVERGETQIGVQAGLLQNELRSAGHPQKRNHSHDSEASKSS